MKNVIVTGLVAIALAGCAKKEEVPAVEAAAPAPAVEAAPAPAAGAVVVKEEGKQAEK